MAFVGDQETFKQDLMDEGLSDLANEAHACILHIDSTYVFPDVPNRDEIIYLNNTINELAKQQIPNTVNGDYFGDHTTAMMPVSTGLTLNDAGYGLTRWNGRRAYEPGPGQPVASHNSSSSGFNPP